MKPAYAVTMLTGFDYCAETDARILILGSMPSRKSLADQQYYAHPRNAFWPIMGALFDFDAALPYQARLQRLKQRRIALWDVAHRCIRPGSLDADMRDVEPNDFRAFFAAHPGIRHIFFNGRKAESLFTRLVRPQLAAAQQALPRRLLPSTSPAHAALSFDEKLAAWRVLKTTLENSSARP